MVPASETAPVRRHLGALRVLHLHLLHLREMVFVALHRLSRQPQLPPVLKVRSSHPLRHQHVSRLADRRWQRTESSLELGASALGNLAPLHLTSTLVLPSNVVLLSHSLPPTLVLLCSVVLLTHSLPPTLVHLCSVVLLSHSLFPTLVLPCSVVRLSHSLPPTLALPSNVLQSRSLLPTLPLQSSVALLSRRLRSRRPPIIVLLVIRARGLTPITIPFGLSPLLLHRPILSYRRSSTPNLEVLLEWLALDAEVSQQSLVPPCSPLLPRLACTSQQQWCLLRGSPRRLPPKRIIESTHLLWALLLVCRHSLILHVRRYYLRGHGASRSTSLIMFN